MKNLLFGLLILLSFVVFVSAQSAEAEKIDEFTHEPCDAYLSRMDAAMDKAYKNPASTIYVLIYEGKEREYNFRKKKTKFVLPKVGSAKAKFESVKRYSSFRRFPTDRFSFIEAGFRENLSVEIWLVPAGAMPPKPTPTLKKMKYRKGKPAGFCVDNGI